MNFTERIDGRVFLVVEIDAAKCGTVRGIFRAFSEGFSFPTWIRKGSLSILDDCMRDLAWLEADYFKVVVKNVKKAEKRDGMGLLSDVLNGFLAYWNQNCLVSEYVFRVEYLG